MALETQILRIPLGGGLAQGEDEVSLEPPGLLECRNVRFEKGGALHKRFGDTLFADDGIENQVGHTVFSHGKQIVQLTETGGFRRCHEAADVTTVRWATLQERDGDEVHPTLPLRIDNVGLYRTSGTILQCDAAVASNGKTCVVFIDNGLIYAIVRDTDGRTVAGPTELEAVGVTIWPLVRVTAIGTVFVVVAHNGSSSFYTWTSDAGDVSPQWSAGSTLAVASVLSFDLAPSNDGTFALLAHDNAGDTQVRHVTSAGGFSGTLTYLGRNCGNGISVHRGGNGGTTAWLATVGMGPSTPSISTFNESTLAGVTGATAAVALVGASVRQIAIVSYVESSAHRAMLVWEEVGDASHSRCVRAMDYDLAITPLHATALLTSHVGMIAKPYRYAGRTVIPAAYKPSVGGTDITTLQPMGFLLAPYADHAHMSCVGRFLVDRLKDTIAQGALCTVVAVTGGHRFACPALGAASTISGVDLVSPMQCDPLDWREIAGVELLAGALPTSYDGTSATEAQPHVYPEQPTVAMSASGSVDAGDHQWIAVYEWEDAGGNLHRSAPSPASAVVTVAANRTATVTLTRLPVTARDGTTQPSYRVALYRTKAGGTTYYLVRRVVPTAGAVVGMVTVTDTLADSALGELLYTTGGELANQAPPPAYSMTLAGNRVALLDSEDRRRVWMSKTLRQGLAPEFAGELSLRIPEGDGTAVAFLDGMLALFTTSSIFLVSGDGPLDTGQQDTWTTPRRLPTLIGCTDPGSVAECPAGIVFRGSKGIHLLARGGTVQYIGAAVEDALGSHRVVRAVHVQRHGEVRFVLEDHDEMLVWNYERNAWSVWDQVVPVSYAPQYPRDMAVIDDRVIWIRDDAETLRYADDEANFEVIGSTGTTYDFLTMSIKTPWIKVAGIGGIQRVRRLLPTVSVEAGTDIELRVVVAVDYVTTAVQTMDFTIASGSVARRAGHLSRQKCEAIRFTLSDREEESQSAAMVLRDLAIEVGRKKGHRRIPATQRE